MNNPPETTDPHSYVTADQPNALALDWSVVVDFENNRLLGAATLRFDRVGPAPITLDTRALDVVSVETDNAVVPFSLGDTDPILGAPLRFELPSGLDSIRIRYATTEDCTALQWLAPEQTTDGTHSYVFSQAQSIHARSMIPLHDSMSRRITYRAEVTVPDGYTALMSAESTGLDRNPDGTTTFTFAAPQSMPPYLIALVVGRLESLALSDRSRVWAEPSDLAAAAWEFAEIETTLRAAESLYGPYRWGRADLVIMPRSYPFGGMENPGLIYLTPTLIAGDRSLVDVVGHEIAHHWSGNLVTAASMEHFWINEGFTTYGERRISELTTGRDYTELNTAFHRADLERDMQHFQQDAEQTKLHRNLHGIDPDATSSWVAHEKGYLFLRRLEEAVGRPAFDVFFRRFFDTFAFQAVTTAEVEAFAQASFPDAIDYTEWLEGAGLPPDTPSADSALLDKIASLDGVVPVAEDVAGWSTTSWLVYLNRLSTPQPLEALTTLDASFGLTGHRNLEIRRVWLALAAASGHQPAIEATYSLVATVGRMKYLKPLYEALLARPELRERTLSAYADNRSAYHPIARIVVEPRLGRTSWS